MNRVHRALGILPPLVLTLAACAAPGTGGGQLNETEFAGSPSAPASAFPSIASADTVQRIDIGALSGDPAMVEGERVAVLARVDEVLVEGRAFLTSPSASEEGQIPVVIGPEAQVDKEIAVGGVVWLEGSVIGLTTDELGAAGVDTSPEDLGAFEGDFVFLADTVADPLDRSGVDPD
jgi:hypothetical protein